MSVYLTLVKLYTKFLSECAFDEICTYVFLCYRGDVPQGMNIKDALKEVLRNALIHDGLARGLREAVKALDKYVLCEVQKF